VRAAALIGCDYKYYQRIEAGLKDVRLSTLERIAKAFGVGVEELLEHSSRESRQGSG
jgi:transcriptional regulator with XRE-family HTH domain